MNRKEALVTAMEVIGVVVVAVGLWLLYPPLAFIAVGISVILGAQLLNRREEG